MRLFLIVFLTLLYACQTLDFQQKDGHGSKKGKLEAEVRSHVAEKLMREKDLIPCGFGSGGFPQIRFLALSFFCHRPLMIEEGRNLVVEAVHELLQAVNSNEEIRPYLSSYPLTAQHVEIVIFVQDSKGNRIPTSSADIFGCYEGICKYKRLNKQGNDLDIVAKEAFAEAEQKAQTNLS